jgi:hypothetical protein
MRFTLIVSVPRQEGNFPGAIPHFSELASMGPFRQQYQGPEKMQEG